MADIIKSKKIDEWYLGLDIGTNSVGWAVTDREYNVQKINGKAMWGSRLFDVANTAEKRRLFRSARRRNDRKVKRIDLLQELFAEEIFKIDPTFFQRLNESKYHLEDKTQQQIHTLFSDDNYTDNNYYEDFPTIFHLRKTLIENKKNYDIRLVYLAIHHILKNRGHFLFEGQDISSIISFNKVYQELKEVLRGELDIELNCLDVNKLANIIKDKKKSIRDKEKEIIRQFEYDNVYKKQVKSILGLIAGSKKKLSDIFNDDSLANIEKASISFLDKDYDETRNSLGEILNDRTYILDNLKAIFDWSILSNILNEKEYLSFAKVEIYNKHKEDLRHLKKVIKSYVPDKYKEIFKDESCENNNYFAYINKKCTQEDFCKYLESLLIDAKTDDLDYKYIKVEIQNRRLLPKQGTKDNGVVPYQLHKRELDIILNNASKYLLFLNNVDETGYSVKEKIMKILEFRIPYYVGPLNVAHENGYRGNCWMVKRVNEPVLPWNFEKIVDVEASAEKFITRLTNKCTYLIGKDVLPKNSLLYSEFMVLNELNNLRINDEKIDVELKKKIYEDLFTKNKKVTNKRLRDYLISNGIIDKNDTITGIDKDFKSSLTSYIDFKNILRNVDDNKDMIEKIIFCSTIYSGDKKLLRNKIKSEFSDRLTNLEINKIIALNYRDWGRLSREFLQDIEHVDKSTGECISIISSLRNTNNNLMGLLSSDYDYEREINKYNDVGGGIDKISYALVEDLRVSPSVKRMMWQSLVIVDELRKIMKSQPEKIFIEMARAKEERNRTISRKNKLEELYKACRKEGKPWLEELSNKSEADLRSDKLYLYYLQKGKCMYCERKIELDSLYNSDLYDIDHIFPKSKCKDDSLDNRVLVHKNCNVKKADIFPVDNDIQIKRKYFWSVLKEQGFISNKKYDRLVRRTPFTDHELADFIARQLVETRQATKAIADILNRVFDDTRVVYVKAENVSDFRHRYDLLKLREINDIHHANDAYLNIVVGNVFDTKFTSNPVAFVEKNKNYSLERMYDFNVKNAWEIGEEGTIKKIMNVMSKNNALITKYSYEGKGQFFDLTIMKAGKGQFPIKSKDEKLSDISKYGGYNKISGAYFMLVEHQVRNKLVRSLEFIPIYLSKKIENDIEAKRLYCEEQLKLVNPRILIQKIKMKSLIEVDGFKMHINGRTNNQISTSNAYSLYLNEEQRKYIRKIVKFLDRKRFDKEFIITDFDKITKEENINLYNVLFDKHNNTIFKYRPNSQAELLKNSYDKFVQLSPELQCEVLMEILHLFQCSNISADLKLIGGAKNAGKILISKNISSYKSVKLINQSPTGIFESEIDLLKI